MESRKRPVPAEADSYIQSFFLIFIIELSEGVFFDSNAEGITNIIFEDMAKKVKDYPNLGTMLRDILFCGKGIPFNLGTELVSIGAMFGFLKDEDGRVAISNRIFEIWFYNLFIAQDAIDSKMYDTR